MSCERKNRSTRWGASLVELLFALVLLAIGATALAGGMRSAVRSVAMGRSWTGGAFAAEVRFEAMRGRCSSWAGAANNGAVTERWAAGAAAGPALSSFVADDSIGLTTAAGPSGRVVRTIVRCTP